jgi:hypothetical protein
MNYKKIEEAYNQSNTFFRLLEREPQYDSPSIVIIDVYNQVKSIIEEELGRDLGEFPNNFENKDARLFFANAASITAPYTKKEEVKEGLIKIDVLENFPGVLRSRLLEANTSYIYGCYTACSALCGSILEAIINEKTPLQAKMTREEQADQFYKEYKLENEKKILNEMREWRHKSAHFSSMEFDENHARIFIDALLITAKRIYK